MSNDALMLLVGVLMVAGGLTAWALSAARRSNARDRAALIAAPLASFDLDAPTLLAYARWQAADLDRERNAMLKRVVKISVWLLAILVPGFAALGAVRTSIDAGALIGLAFSGLIIGPLLLVCGALALRQTLSARRLRHSSPLTARMHVGVGGIAFEPGAYHSLYGTPFAARMLNGPPLVLDLVTRYGSNKGMRYLHARGPIPAAQTAAAWAALRELRQRWNLPAE